MMSNKESKSPVRSRCDESAKESGAESDGAKTKRSYNLRSRSRVTSNSEKSARKETPVSSEIEESDKEETSVTRGAMYERSRYPERERDTLETYNVDLGRVESLRKRSEMLDAQLAHLSSEIRAKTVEAERKRDILEQVMDVVQDLKIAADTVESERIQALTDLKQCEREHAELVNLRKVKDEQKHVVGEDIDRLDREIDEAINERTKAESELEICREKIEEAKKLRVDYEREEEKVSQEWELGLQEKAKLRYHKFRTEMSTSEMESSDVAGEKESKSRPSHSRKPRPKRSTPKAKQKGGRHKSHVSDSSSESERDGSSYRKLTMKPQRYNGKTVFADFLSQFEACKAYNGWSDREAAFHLFNHCDTDALSSLTNDGLDPKVSSYREMVDVLEREHGPRECKSSYILELNHVRQQSGESARELGNRIKRLTALAFRGKDAGTKTTREEMGLNCFTLALRRKDVRDAVFGAEYETLKQAIDKAEYLESYHKRDDELHERKRDKHVAFSRKCGQERYAGKGSDSESEIEERVYDRLIRTFGLIPADQVKVPSQSNESELEVSVRTLVDTTKDLRDTLAKVHTRPPNAVTVTPPPRRRATNHVVCYACSEPGHVRRECPRQHQTPPPPKRSSSPVRGYCLNCLQQGHEWRDCLLTPLCFMCHQDNHLSRNCPQNAQGQAQGNGWRPSHGPQGRPNQQVRGQGANGQNMSQTQ